jgi:hypothetical protein
MITVGFLGCMMVTPSVLPPPPPPQAVMKTVAINININLVRLLKTNMGAKINF